MDHAKPASSATPVTNAFFPLRSSLNIVRTSGDVGPSALRSCQAISRSASGIERHDPGLVFVEATAHDVLDERPRALVEVHELDAHAGALLRADLTHAHHLAEPLDEPGAILEAELEVDHRPLLPRVLAADEHPALRDICRIFGDEVVEGVEAILNEEVQGDATV